MMARTSVEKNTSDSYVERETGLEPATACLEGRYAQKRRSPALDKLEKSVHTTTQKGTLN